MKIIALLLPTLMLTGMAPAQTSASGYQLWYSASTTRSAPTLLSGRTVSGSIYVFTSNSTGTANPSGIFRVCYWLDNTAMSGTPTHCENLTPYDYAGTNTSNGTAYPWDTTKIANGTHTITQAVTPTRGSTQNSTATVTVSNGANIAITISPTSASLQTNGTQQFAATVSGSSNKAVTWSATAGSISSTGLYTAPRTAGSYVVKATSVADPTKAASVTVTVSTAPAVSVTISPTTASVLASGTQQFTATVSGSSNVAVTWSATAGSISSTGLYTAPATAGSYTVKATSVANITKSASVTVTVSVLVQHTVTLAWAADTSAVAGYNVYRGSISGGPYTRINSVLEAATHYVDNTVLSGQTYYYVTTAVNSAGAESAYSNQVVAHVPSP